jgi:hypothetical protein
MERPAEAHAGAGGGQTSITTTLPMSGFIAAGRAMSTPPSEKHCAEGEKPDAWLIKSMIPGRNQHEWVHKKCLVELTRQHGQEASS